MSWPALKLNRPETEAKALPELNGAAACLGSFPPPAKPPFVWRSKLWGSLTRPAKIEEASANLLL